MTDKVIDLVAAAEALPPEQRKLKDLILRLRDAHSIKTDLTLATDFVASMHLIQDAASKASSGDVAENSYLALLYTTIVLYVRATKTSSDHRRSFNFLKSFDAEERASHQILCDLRDDAIAHFGPGGSYRGTPWQVEGVFIPIGPGADGNIMTASRRLVINPQIVAMIGKQVHRALMVALRITHEQDKAVAAEINALVEADAIFLNDLRNSTTTLADFFNSREAAADILSGPRVGYRRGTARHSDVSA
jgi:hypothetical protein